MNLDGSTNRATLEKEIRDEAASCDLAKKNMDYFLLNTFIMNMASLIQKKEAEAFRRGFQQGGGGKKKLF